MSRMNVEEENASLRAQVAALEQRLGEQEQASREQTRHLEGLAAELQDQTHVLEAIFNSIADGIIVSDALGSITRVNKAGEQILVHVDFSARLGAWSASFGLYRTDMATPVAEEDVPLARAVHGEAVDSEELFLRNQYRPEGFFLQANARPIFAEDGALRGAVGVFRDISERKRWERQLEEQLVREREKNDTLARLRSAVEELSTPILEVWDDVLALPVIGVVDSRRSAEMMERLLAAVEETQCRFVIIDITGVEVVDSATADRLLKVARAVEILGAQCLLTGARSAVAQTLVSIGANLGSIMTRRNLKHGLQECLRALDAAGGRFSPRARSGRAAMATNGAGRAKA